jgi:hypothetical protein
MVAETRNTMAKTKKSDEETTSEQPTNVGAAELAAAFRDAFEASKPVTKKTMFNRKKNTPWTPKDGSAKLKFKRKTYHHGLILGSKVSNEEIALCNQLRPGVFCDGFVKVIRRKDRGIDIEYPIRTAAQKLKLVNQFGIRNFKELLERLVNEGQNPVAFKAEDDLD